MATTSTRLSSMNDRDSRARRQGWRWEADEDHDGASTQTASLRTSPNGRFMLSKPITNSTSSMRSTSTKQPGHSVRLRHPLCVPAIIHPIIKMACPPSAYRLPCRIQTRVFPLRRPTPRSAPHPRSSRQPRQGPTAHDPATRRAVPHCRLPARAPSGRPLKGGPRPPAPAPAVRARVASRVSMTSTRTPVRHPDKDAAKISPASAAKRLPSAGCTTPVALKRSVKNVVEKNGSRKTSPSPSPRLGRVEIVKERAKTDIDKENTPSAPPTELPDDDDDMAMDMHTVFTAPEAHHYSPSPRRRSRFRGHPRRAREHRHDHRRHAHARAHAHRIDPRVLSPPRCDARHRHPLHYLVQAKTVPRVRALHRRSPRRARPVGRRRSPHRHVGRRRHRRSCMVRRLMGRYSVL